jgi:uncharacterized protein (TIGR02598 family)
MKKRLPLSSRSAFSLVEVALAVGIVSFAMLGVMGTLSVGLQTVRDSINETAKANIAGHLRGEFQRTPFTTSTASDYNIDGLEKETYFYTRDGLLIANGNDARAYYKAEFKVNNGVVSSPSGDSSFQSTSARNITVTLKFPVSASSNDQQTSVFSIFSAKQRNG